jgi:DNA-binding MarR family transcriptional regulator
MKQLEKETKPSQCAALLLDAVPLVMRTIRAEMRSHRGAGLSLPQFRTLFFLRRNAGASLSAVAEHVGLTPPSASKMLDGLIARNLASRRESLADRRRVTLALTAQGRAALKKARDRAQVQLAEMLSTLPATDHATIAEAMTILQCVFSSSRETERR